MLTYYNITQQGQRHIEKDVPCQDFSAVHRLVLPKTGQEIVIAAIADGVGSCLYSQHGSREAVESAVRCITDSITAMDEEMASDASFPLNERIEEALEKSFRTAVDSVEKLADDMELPFLEFDSTLTVAVYDGDCVWYGHVGDDGIVVLYGDGSYEMITKRHKADDPMFMIPLSETDRWEFGHTDKKVASFAMMTDGVLDHCVDKEAMNNRVYFPFLKPALTSPMRTEEDMAAEKADWEEYLAGSDKYPVNFRSQVTDDITFTVVQNPEAAEKLPEIVFDFDKWEADTERRRNELNEILYADYRAYQAKRRQQLSQNESSEAVSTPAEDDSASTAEPEPDKAEDTGSEAAADTPGTEEGKNSLPPHPDKNRAPQHASPGASQPSGSPQSAPNARHQPKIQPGSPSQTAPPKGKGRQEHVQPVTGQQFIECTVNAIDSLIRFAFGTGKLARDTFRPAEPETKNKTPAQNSSAGSENGQAEENLKKRTENKNNQD